MSPQTDGLPPAVPPLGRLGAALRTAWRSGYDGAALRQDAMAGIVVGIVALPLSMALKKDFFKSEGLNILEVLFRSGPTAIQALVSGSIQFSTGFGTGTRAAMAAAPL